MFEHRKVRGKSKSISIFPFNGAKYVPVPHLLAVGRGGKLLTISGPLFPHS